MKDLVRATWGPGRRWTPGEVAWSVLVEDDHEVGFVGDGFCWLQPDAAVVLATSRTGVEALLGLVGDRPVQVPHSDLLLRTSVRELGATELEGAPFDLDMRLPTAGAAAPAPPPGYTVRSARPDDDLVGVHRAGWRPYDLPFAPAHRATVDPAATSGFDAARLAAVQADEDHRRDLHIVVEARDGSLAGSCIGWFDAPTAVTAVEPLAVHPAHRRLGLAGAMCLEVARRSAALGAAEVVIHPRGDAAYPAPRGAYARVGFRRADRTALHDLRCWPGAGGPRSRRR